MLTGLLTEEPSPVRSAALEALAASLTATRLTADALAALLDDPVLGTTAAIALGSVGDLRAVPHLVRLLESGDPSHRLAEAFAAVARAGADPAAPVDVARRILAAHPGPCVHEGGPRPCRTALAMRVLASFGPAAAAATPDLIVRVEAALDRNESTSAIDLLERIGPAAAAAVPVLRRCPPERAARALVMITSERAVADRYLAGRPETLRHGSTASALLTWLTEHGGLTVRQHRQLRHQFTVPGSVQLGVAGALWRHEGPSVADELLEQLGKFLDDDLRGLPALRVLAAMGAHARPILGRLEKFVAARRRAGISVGGDEAAEMRADEQLLAATIDARDRIAASAGQRGGQKTI